MIPTEPHNNPVKLGRLNIFIFISYPNEVVPGKKISDLPKVTGNSDQKIGNLTPSFLWQRCRLENKTTYYLYVCLWDHGVAVTIPGRTIFATNYYKYPTEETWWMRGADNMWQLIEHIIRGCTTVEALDYINRHNDVAKIMHPQLSLEGKVINGLTKYREHKPSNT